MDMNEILDSVNTYGILPLLFLVIWVLYKKTVKLEQNLNDKQDELLESAKENVSLLHKVIAVVNKITKKDIDEL